MKQYPEYQAHLNEEYHPVALSSDEKKNVALEIGDRLDRTIENSDFSVYHVFLVCDLIAIFGFVIGFFTKLISFEILSSLYVLVHIAICIMMFIMNFPNWDALHGHRTNIRSLFRFFSLITGQSIILMYLGLSFFVVVWPASGSKHAALLIMVSLLCGGICLLGGIGGILVALTKRQSLEAVRKLLHNQLSATTSSTADVIKLLLNHTKSQVDFFLLADFPCFVQGLLHQNIHKNYPSLTDSALLFNAIDAEGHGHLTVDQVANWIETRTPLL